MPSLPQLAQPLHDERVTVRLAAERDIPEILIAHQDDPRLHQRLGLERPPSGAELGRQMEQASQQRVAGARVILTILEPGSEECCGQIEVCEIDWTERRAGVRLWVAPQARGRGLGRAALELTKRWLSEAGGLELRDA
jgi:RimJ/RimL family protein N-acetyltransferase